MQAENGLHGGQAPPADAAPSSTTFQQRVINKADRAGPHAHTLRPAAPALSPPLTSWAAVGRCAGSSARQRRSRSTTSCREAGGPRPGEVGMLAGLIAAVLQRRERARMRRWCGGGASCARTGCAAVPVALAWGQWSGTVGIWIRPRRGISPVQISYSSTPARAQREVGVTSSMQESCGQHNLEWPRSQKRRLPYALPIHSTGPFPQLLTERVDVGREGAGLVHEHLGGAPASGEGRRPGRQQGLERGQLGIR